MFGETFLSILIIVALVWTGLGAVVLVALLIRDKIRRQIW